MVAALASSESRSGTTTPRPATTTVFPSRVGRRLRPSRGLDEKPLHRRGDSNLWIDDVIAHTAPISCMD